MDTIKIRLVLLKVNWKKYKIPLDKKYHSDKKVH